ncbi:tripartite motif containing 16, partial [Homo sapiens]
MIMEDWTCKLQNRVLPSEDPALSQKGYLKKENMAALCRTAESQAELQCTQLDLERKLKLNENAISRLQANQKSVLVSVSEVKAVAEMQFGELLAAV